MENMKYLQEKISRTDMKILDLLSKRMKLADEIAKCKARKNLPIFNKEREKQVEEMWMKQAEKLGLNSWSVSLILQEILSISKKVQIERIKIWRKP